MRQIAEIENLPTSSANKSIMEQGVQEETQEKLDKAYWNSFKDSDMYIRMFEDLESQSTRSINRMRKELEHYRTSLNDLDPASLKEIVSRLDALDEQIAKRNPFKGLSEAYKNYREVIKEYGSRNDLEDSLAINRSKEQALIERVDDQQIKVETERKALNDALLQGNVLEISARRQSLAYEEETLDVMVKQLAAQKGITKEEAKRLLKLDNAQKMFSGSMSDIGRDISEISNALPTLMGDLESMGVGFSDSMKDAVESVAEIGSGVGNAIQGFESGNYIQGVLGVTQAIAGVFKIGDKKKEREIKALTEKVEELGRAYEKLQKQIENAFSLDQFRAGYAQSKENLEQQIQATEDMIAAEQAKKDTDDERIREWQNNIEDYKEQLKELEDQRLQELGGFGESGIKSAADDFVDAWLTAYQETGDGLDALEDKWDEYIRNIIKKQMALRVADKVIEPITKKVDEALYDSALTDDELAEIDKMAEEKSKEFNQMMHQLANYFGSATDALKENVELSGLTQGIQGVTEQTADQLAGLVNSIRLYSANNNATLIRIADAMEQNKPQTENPMVAQLRQLVMHTESIYDLLNNLTIDGGKSINVKM
jgi:DNA repair exonuclease SbcCD ATPase subunit